MQTKDQAYAEYCADLEAGTYNDPKKRKRYQGKTDILGDGESLRVPVMAMDSNPASQQIMLTDSQRQQIAQADQDQARVQAYADHFTDLRNQSGAAARAENPAYFDYCQRIAAGSA